MVVQDSTFANDLPRRDRTSARQEQAREEELSYWRRQLAGVTVPALPTCRSASPGADSWATDTFEVPPDAAARLSELIERQGTALLDLAVSAVQVVLARHSGSEDVAVATVVNDCDESANDES